MAIEPFKIENESEADEYLTALFAKDKYKSMDEVTLRAQKYITDERVRVYFVTKAKEMLGIG
jgi:hypothetical protein